MRPRSEVRSQRAQRSDHVELRRPVHGQVDLVVVELSRGAEHRLGPDRQPAEVAPVEDVDGREVRGVVVRTPCPQLLQRAAVGLRHGVDQPGRLRHELRRRARRAREDQPHDARASASEVLDREPAAPGLPEQVTALEPERLADDVELLHRTIDRPERRIVRLLRLAAAELVEHDHRSVRSHPLDERVEVVVAGAGAPVQREQRRRGPLAESLVPDASTGDVDHAGLAHAASSWWRRSSHAPHATRLDAVRTCEEPETPRCPIGDEVALAAPRAYRPGWPRRVEAPDFEERHGG